MIYNSDNPFVHNQYYFLNVTNVYYEQTLLSKIHLSVHLFAFVCGILTCLLLMYLTLNKTPQIFEKYSKLIFMSVSIDFVYLLVNFACQFVKFLK